MEEEFLNLGLDIIGLGVFNYDFGSITRESPVIKVRPLSSCLLARVNTGIKGVIGVSSVPAELNCTFVMH